MTRYFFDTEFMEDGRTIELISIGVVADDGREYYAENKEADLARANPWVREHVLPLLGLPDAETWKTRAWIRYELASFLFAGKPPVELWAYYGQYDMVALCQLWGTMMDLPAWMPQHVLDVKQLAVMLGNPRLPAQTSTQHHALNDARWTREAWLYLRGLTTGGAR